jgi:hypothetical protein
MSTIDDSAPPPGMPTPAATVVHEIDILDLRQIFPREDHDFTPWLARTENLARLARTLDCELELIMIEAGIGAFRTDILARNVRDGTIVVIENQFRRSDHDHLGKALTYLAAHDAKTVIWLAESFADEHRATLAWLNDHTPEDVGFYAVAPRLMRIAASPPGLQFEIVVAPNRFVKTSKSSFTLDPALAPLRAAFWSYFLDQANAEPTLAACKRRYGGRLGFLWLLPPVADEWAGDEPHVLVYLTAPTRGPQGVGLEIYGRDRMAGNVETAERLEQLRTALGARGVLGLIPADLADEDSQRQAAAQLMTRAKDAVEELIGAFGG